VKYQWINLRHGDTLFMSLSNHRYLAAANPNEPGKATATTAGFRPAKAANAANGRPLNEIRAKTFNA
jgi:hypothetical protein